MVRGDTLETLKKRRTRLGNGCLAALQGWRAGKVAAAEAIGNCRHGIYEVFIYHKSLLFFF
jgi:hypothetical protein